MKILHVNIYVSGIAYFLVCDSYIANLYNNKIIYCLVP